MTKKKNKITSFTCYGPENGINGKIDMSGRPVPWTDEELQEMHKSHFYLMYGIEGMNVKFKETISCDIDDHEDLNIIIKLYDQALNQLLKECGDYLIEKYDKKENTRITK